MAKWIKRFFKFIDDRRERRNNTELEREEKQHLDWIARNSGPEKLLEVVAEMIGAHEAKISMSEDFLNLAQAMCGIDLKEKYGLVLECINAAKGIVEKTDKMNDAAAEAFSRGERAPKAAELQQAG